jgi:NADH-quinone oxidoreductase subunit E
LIGAPGHVTSDGLFSWSEVECLGACVNAPVAQINKDYYEDLTPESLEDILEGLAAGRPVAPGPQVERQASAPIGGPTTLTDPELYRNEERDAPPNPRKPGMKRASRKNEEPVPR